VQRQPIAPEPAAKGRHLGAQLGGDVGDDAIVGGRRAPEHGNIGAAEAIDHAADAAVVGAKVVPPVGDAMHLVDHDQPGPSSDDRHDLAGELGVGEPFGRHHQQIDVIGGQHIGQLVDRGVAGAVDRHAPQTQPLGGVDLVAHQRQQRRDQQGGTGARLPQQVRAEKVDRTLAPARTLHDQHPRPVVDEGLDRLALTVTELGVGAAGQPAEGIGELVGHQVGHVCTLTGRCDIERRCRRFSPCNGGRWSSCRGSSCCAWR
jgi:hypothetical protein